MAETIQRVVSCVIAAAYLIVALVQGGVVPAITVAIFLLLPMACIWFPDEMGSLAYVRGMPMNETPGCLVIFGGWMLLLLPVIVTIVRYVRQG